MEKEQIIRCMRPCSIGKHCFVVKLKEMPPIPITVMHKCAKSKQDVEIVIGGNRPP